MIYHERINRPAHVETYHEGGFFVVEWTNESIDLGKIVNEEFGENDWIERYGNKEKFLKAFLGKKNGVFMIWLSSDAISTHSSLFTSISNNDVGNIKVCGELIKNGTIFVVSSSTLYKKGFLNREKAESWVNENLPAWI
jgi:hypothetical protein